MRVHRANASGSAPLRLEFFEPHASPLPRAQIVIEPSSSSSSSSASMSSRSPARKAARPPSRSSSPVARKASADKGAAKSTISTPARASTLASKDKTAKKAGGRLMVYLLALPLRDGDVLLQSDQLLPHLLD